MWLEDRYALARAQSSPVLLLGGEAYGAPFLIERLKRDTSVAWIVVSPADAPDPIALGNLLAAQVNRVVGGTFLQHALPYAAHLESLRRHHAGLPAFTLAVSNAETAPEFASAVCRALRDRAPVWLASAHDLPCVEAQRVTSGQLRLSETEAADLAPRAVGSSLIERLYRDTQGAYTLYLANLHREAGMPDVMVPAGDTRMLAQHQASAESPEDAFEALVRLDRHADALEVAAEFFPERVEDLLVRAGPEYQQRGILARLHILLSMLYEPYRSRERTLEWRFLAAAHAGSINDLRPAIERHLQQHEAPELRARYATALPHLEGVRQAERAAGARATPLTLWQYGRMIDEHERGVDLLVQSLELAERHGDTYGVVRASGSLAARHIQVGDYVAAQHWAAYGLRAFDDDQLKDGPRRLKLVNSLAVARAMQGDTAGLREQLTDVYATLENTVPMLASEFRATLADLERLHGDARRARELTAANLHASIRTHKHRRALQHTRSLIEAGDPEEALRTAQGTLALLHGADLRYTRCARIALGVAQAFLDPEQARATLAPALTDPHLMFEDRATASLYYLLAHPGGMQELAPDMQQRLPKLHDAALRILAGPREAMHEVFDDLQAGARPPLELRVLGTPAATLRGKPVKFTKRVWDVVLALALHPDGLTYENLHAFLLRDSDQIKPGTMRTYINYLRKSVPVTDTPLRLDLPYVLDLARARDHLLEGDVHAAISLVGGTVMPESDLPGVREVREHFEATLREAVLTHRDPDALYEAVKLWPDDLQVWEAALDALRENDPRVPLARTTIHRLRDEYAER